MLLPKPEPRARARRRAARREAAVKARVRAAVARRDGYCRLRHVAGLPACGGPSQWAHLGEHRRFRTRGRPPEQRHCEEGSLMLCDRHHDLYDCNRLAIEPASPALGAAGRLMFRFGGFTWEEPA